MAARGVNVSELAVWRDDGLDAEPRQVLAGVSFDFGAGERVAVVGANGAGKTSLLLALVGAVPFQGQIAFGQLVLEKKSLAAVRREVAFVFAEPSDQLFLPSVEEEVAFAPRQRGRTEAEVTERVARVLAQVGLRGAERRAPAALSLGEQRRLALATALSADPAVLLLDEPTASLDGRARRAVLAALRATQATLLFASHDLAAVRELATRVVLLGNGELLAAGPAREIMFDAALLDRAGLDAE